MSTSKHSREEYGWFDVLSDSVISEICHGKRKVLGIIIAMLAMSATEVVVFDLSIADTIGDGTRFSLEVIMLTFLYHGYRWARWLVVVLLLLGAVLGLIVLPLAFLEGEIPVSGVVSLAIFSGAIYLLLFDRSVQAFFRRPILAHAAAFYSTAGRQPDAHLAAADRRQIQAVLGRQIVLAVCFAILAAKAAMVALALLGPAHGFRISVVQFVLFAVLCSGAYMGKSWARGMLLALLVWYDVAHIYDTLTGQVNLIRIGLAYIYTVSIGALLFTPSVKLFFDGCRGLAEPDGCIDSQFHTQQRTDTQDREPVVADHRPEAAVSVRIELTGDCLRWVARMSCDELEVLMWSIGVFGRAYNQSKLDWGRTPEPWFGPHDMAEWRMRMALKLFAKVFGGVGTESRTFSAEYEAQSCTEVEWRIVRRFDRQNSDQAPGFNRIFAERLRCGHPLGRWAADLNERQLWVLLWSVGEYGVRVNSILGLPPPIFDVPEPSAAGMRLALKNLARIMDGGADLDKAKKELIECYGANQGKTARS